MNKLRVMFDMDDTLGDHTNHLKMYKSLYPKNPFPQSVTGFYESIPPIKDALECLEKLSKLKTIDLYILTAPSIKNPICYTEKRRWSDKHAPFLSPENLIICHDKSLVVGDVLIDDRLEGNGQEFFEGNVIQVGGDTDWDNLYAVLEATAEIELHGTGSIAIM